MARKSLLRRALINLRLSVGISLRENTASTLRNLTIMKIAISAWHKAALRGKGVGALQLRCNSRALMLCMAAWTGFVHKRQCKTVARAIAASHLYHRLSLDGFRAWRLWLSVVKDVMRPEGSPEMERRAAWGRALTLRRRAFIAWRSYLTGSRFPKVISLKIN